MARRPSPFLLLSSAVLLAGGVTLAAYLALVQSPSPGPVAAPVGRGASTEPSAPLGAPAPAAPLEPAPEDMPADVPVELATGALADGSARAAADDLELSGAIWIRGRVIFPPGTPAGERVVIEADGNEFEHRPLHRAEVGPDGSFRVAFAPMTRKARLRVHARHLYDPERQRIDLKGLEGEWPPLELSLGGRIEGVVHPPQLTAAERRQLVGAEVMVGESWRIHGRATLDQDLAFEFDAVPPGAECWVHFPSDWLADGRSNPFPVEGGATARVELALRRGVRVTGRVLTAEGTPPVDGQLGVRRESRASWIAWEDLPADGRIDLAGLEPGGLSLHARAPDWLAGQVDLGALVDGQVLEDVEVTLARGHGVRGRAQWPDATPVVAAEVELTEPVPDPVGAGLVSADVMIGAFDSEGQTHSPQVSQRTHQRETDEQGRFELAGLGPGPYELEVRARPEPPRAEGESLVEYHRRQRFQPTWRARRDGLGPDSELLLTLSSGLAFSGRVVDDRRLGVPEFTLSARRVDVEREWARGSVRQRFVSPDGRFVMEGLEPGIWSLRVDARGHGRGLEQVLELPAPGPEAVFELSRTSAVAGTLVDPAGVPVRGGVDIEGLDTWLEPLQIGRRTDRSDLQGRFEIDDAPTGRVRIRGTGKGWAPSAALEAELRPGQVLSGLRLTLRRGGRITGELRPGPGRSPSGHWIALQDASSMEELARAIFDPRGLTTTSDDEGRFVFEQLAPGDYLITATDGGVESGRALLSVADGQTQHVVLGPTPAAAVLLRGRVRQGGQPARGYRLVVEASPRGGGNVPSVTTGDDGRFELALPGPGDYALGLYMPEEEGAFHRSVHPVRVPAVSEHALDLDLPGGSMAGIVIGPGGDPLGGVWVHLYPAGAGSGAGTWAGALSGEDGRFELAALADGEYALRIDPDEESASASACASLRRDGLVVSGGARLSGIELRLEPPGVLAGVVRDANGSRAGKAQVFLRSEGSAGLMATVTDAAGRFEIERVPAGSWTVCARRGSSFGESRPVALVRGGSAAVDVTLGAGTLLLVTVLEDGLRSEYARLSVRDQAGREHADLGGTRANSAATHVVGALPPGSYRLRATYPDGATLEREVSLDGEPELSLELARN